MVDKCCACGESKSTVEKCRGGAGFNGHRFENMISNCLEYTKSAKDAGRPIVGIMCEFTPRELIMAAGGVPVCLCGGSADTIATAETELPVNLCPLIKSTYGYHLEKSNPFLEMADLVVAETTCDGKKKMFELMGRTREIYVLELPQKAGDSDAMEHWGTELRKFRGFLQDRFNTEIGDDKIRAASSLMNRERALRRKLAATMAANEPSLTGRQLLKLKSSISGIAADLEEYEKTLSRLQQSQITDNKQSRVRTLMTGVPMAHGAERVLDIIESSGGLVVAMENCTGLKPILEDVDVTANDIMAALTETYFHLPCSVMTPNDRRIDTIQRMAEIYRPECIIELTWQACLTYDVESNRVRRLAEERLGIPYLHIETDYSPSDSARIAVRVEALFETVRAD